MTHTNETARNLMAKLEITHELVAVRSLGMDIANTYAGKLVPYKMSQKKLKRDSETCMLVRAILVFIKLTELDGEYLFFSRMTLHNTNLFVQYGFGATWAVGVTE